MRIHPLSIYSRLNWNQSLTPRLCRWHVRKRRSRLGAKASVICIWNLLWESYQGGFGRIDCLTVNCNRFPDRRRWYSDSYTSSVQPCSLSDRSLCTHNEPHVQQHHNRLNLLSPNLTKNQIGCLFLRHCSPSFRTYTNRTFLNEGTFIENDRVNQLSRFQCIGSIIALLVTG